MIEFLDLFEDFVDVEMVRFWVWVVDESIFEVVIGGIEDDDEGVVIGFGVVKLLSGGFGLFVGSLVGVYVICYGNGDGEECFEGGEVYFINWWYIFVV